MNQLSWPATILLGIMFGLLAVAAARTVEERAAADGADKPSPSASSSADPSSGSDSPGSGSGDSSGSDDGSGENPAGDSEGSSDGDSDGDSSGATGVSAGSDYSIVLTFDDGPHPTYTPQVLDILEEHDATAVFCVVGERVREHPETLRQIVVAGHALCNHTDTHDELLSERSRAQIERQISATDEAIESAAGGDVEVRWFRQPNTFVQPEVRPVLDGFDLEPLDWTIDPRDWSRPGTMSIVQDVLADVRPGAVVLLHDGGGDRSQTVAALEEILGGLDAASYRTRLPGDS